MTAAEMLVAGPGQDRAANVSIFPKINPRLRDFIRGRFVEDVRLLGIVQRDIRDAIALFIFNGHTVCFLRDSLQSLRGLQHISGVTGHTDLAPDLLDLPVGPNQSISFVPFPYISGRPSISQPMCPYFSATVFVSSDASGNLSPYFSANFSIGFILSGDTPITSRPMWPS